MNNDNNYNGYGYSDGENGTQPENPQQNDYYQGNHNEEPVYGTEYNPYQNVNYTPDASSQAYNNGYSDQRDTAYQSQPTQSEESFNPYTNHVEGPATPFGGYSYGQYNQGSGYGAPPSPSGKKENKGFKIAIGVVVACLIFAVVLIFALSGSGEKAPGTVDVETTAAETTAAAQSTTQSTVEVATTAPATQEKDPVWIAENVRKSVVGVMVYEEGQLAGEGSGVLMSEKDGYTYVVTCAHVVEIDDVTYGILLLDGRSFEAELVASDTRTDIAVLKVEATGLPLAQFGDSSSLKVGETIYAIGNPGGSEYFGSMTDGIVSAIDRSITATYTMTCIQHNAAINPGNSGGALVNSQGQVIGINSSKIASTEYEGMGFAVPTAIAKPVVDALIQYGYVPNRPKLGIEYAPVSSYQLYSMVVMIKGLPQGSLVIAGISEDSSLVNTEAEVGDLIIGVNGKEMDDSSVLLDLIDTGAVGDTITLTLCRIESRTYKTSTFDVTITLVEDKGSSKQESTTEAADPDGYYHGGSESFEDFFDDYFGDFGW